VSERFIDELRGQLVAAAARETSGRMASALRRAASAAALAALLAACALPLLLLRPAPRVAGPSPAGQAPAAWAREVTYSQQAAQGGDVAVCMRSACATMYVGRYTLRAAPRALMLSGPAGTTMLLRIRASRRGTIDLWQDAPPPAADCLTAAGAPAHAARYEMRRQGRALVLTPVDDPCVERRAVLGARWAPAG
jgi:hypothetical protein